MDIPSDRKCDNILFIYDIACDKRRRRVVKILEGYGIRVQYSAFEAYINQKQYKNLVKQLLPEFNFKEDSLRSYVLYSPAKVESWGRECVQLADTIIF